MTAVHTGDLCPITVRAPGVGFELAVPVDVPLAELLPVLLTYAGPELVDHDPALAGWTLQRLGGEPLDEDRTASALGLREGETLYLRPRGGQLPAVHFDDLVDGVADTLGARADTWRPAYTRVLLLGLAVASLAAGLVLMLRAGPDGPAGWAGAGLALVLLVGAGAAARAVGDGPAGVVLGLAAVPFAAFAGAALPTEGTAARLLAGCAAGAGIAALAAVCTGMTAPVYLAVAVTGTLGVVAGLLVEVCDLSGPQAAGCVATVVTVLGASVPVLAARLGGLRLPPLPGDAGQLQEGIDPLHAPTLVIRATRTDRYMTALYAACGVTCVGCLTPLAAASGWVAPTLAGGLSALLVLHGRVLRGAWHRLAVVAAGTYGAAAIAVLALSDASTRSLAIALGLLATLAAGCVAASRTIPGRRQLPYWGRIADLLHSLAALILLPLLLTLVGVFGAIRDGIGS